MNVFRNGPFEMGFNMETMTQEQLSEFFQMLHDCAECGAYPEELRRLENEVWKTYLKGGAR